MDGSPDPLVVILGTVAFALATIGGLFAFAWLWAKYAQRMVPSSAEQEEMLRAVRERQAAWAASLKWALPLSLLLIALAVAGIVVAAVNGWSVLLVLALMLLMPASFILSGISIVKSQMVFVNRGFRPVQMLTGKAAVRRGWIQIGFWLIMLLACLLLGLLIVAGGGPMGGLPSPPAADALTYCLSLGQSKT